MALTKIEASNIAAGAVASSGFAGVHSDVSSGSETYTVPADITKLLVIITGGGGGGGGSVNAQPQGTGGGSATTVIARVTVVPADTITIAIGAAGAGGGTGADGVDGGDSTFTHATGSGSGSMSTITAPGGKKGVYLSLGNPTAPTAGTVGANNEGIAITGGYGGIGSVRSGAPSFWGQGGRGGDYAYMVSKIGYAPGSGGGGGQSVTSYLVGSAGGDGICFIMEFK